MTTSLLVPPPAPQLPPAARRYCISACAARASSDGRPGAAVERAAAEMEFAPYRGQTIWLLRRYFRTSLQIGRLPGILGREFFRARVSSRKACTFEDEVIFATDLDRCVARLDPQEKYLVGALVMKEYDQEQLAEMMGLTRKWVRFHFYRALDKLTRVLLAGGYIIPKPGLQAA